MAGIDDKAVENLEKEIEKLTKEVHKLKRDYKKRVKFDDKGHDDVRDNFKVLNQDRKDNVKNFEGIEARLTKLEKAKK